MKRMLRLAAAVLGLAASVPLALAHHGWSSFDQTAPIYLTGVIKKVQWRNPHAELVLQVDKGMKVPEDLGTRAVPAQSAGIDGAALLARAAVPKRSDAGWTVELAPLSRMEAWRVPELKAGERVEIIGFTFAGEKGEAVLRAEYLVHNGRIFGLRSSPAQ